MNAPNFNDIPADLKALPAWVVWKLEPRPDQAKPAKVPYNPRTGRRADSTRPDTGGAFEEAKAAYEHGGYAGVGIILAAGSGLVGVDLDNCRDPETGAVEQWAQAIVAALSAYAEVSPSGTGLRIFVWGRKPGPKCRRGPIEMYDRDRFLTVTGQWLPKTELDAALGMVPDVAERSTELAAVYAEHLGADGAAEHTADLEELAGTSRLTDKQVLELSASDAKFQTLFAGDWPAAKYPSQSEADIALCIKLASYCGRDPEQVDRLFRESGLFREKWEREDYAARTLQKAIGMCKEVHPAQGVGAIQIRDGEMHRVVDQCEELLLQSDLPDESRVFQRGGQLVRVVVLPTAHSGGGVERPAGSAIIVSVDKPWLLDTWGRVGNFEKYSRQRDQWEGTNPPRDAAEIYAARKGRWRVPVLRGIVTCPTLRPDGSMLVEPGYDEATGYYLADGLRVEAPEAPRQVDAAAALDSLRRLLAGFSFVAEVDQSVALALLLTAIARPAIASSPIVNISAPVRGSGKSTLVDVAAVLATGKRAAVLSATADPAELEKRVVGCLLSGDPLVSLDNLNGQLASDLLCQASTAEAVKLRPLGGSGQVEIENTTLWTANGNNLVVSGDLARRALLCRMDPGVERPEERTFAFDPIIRAREHRAVYVSAALTIMRAYVVAGRPDQGLTPFGSFERWSAMVRASLVWAGAADPCASRASVLDEDPEAARLRALLSAWWAQYGAEPVTVRAVIGAGQVLDSPLCEPLGEIAGDGPARFNTQRLGIWLRRNMGRVAGGRKLQRAGTVRDGATWQVVEV